ncbi:MAG: beta-ketoacyl-[acyl-carrier-protein] synthase family protein [Dehalococcoidia bacterium]|nr:beta-ketoacyl-[acyl-carrier-protein] synthase family protein [Dehalococcoidia bacterium]
MSRDVVITGIGAVTPYGTDLHAYYDALAAGEIAIRPTPWMPPESGLYTALVPDFEPLDWMSPRVADGTDRFAQYALAGTRMALDHAGLSQLDQERTAIVLGTAMGGTRALQRGQSLLERDGPDAVPRKLQIQVWPNMAAAQIAMEYDVHGPSLTICTACAASIDAIGTATRFIQSGLADVAITGAMEGSNGEVDFLPALSANQMSYGMVSPTTDPTKACRPFDADRTGIAGGDGGAIFVLESAEHARARGAKQLGVIRGYASLADGYHPSSPEPTGKWESLVMRRALADAGLGDGAGVVGVYAHGTGTRAGDAAEIHAINDVYGYRGRDLLVTSLKGHFGHPGGSAASLNLAAALVGMQRGEILQTASTTTPDPEIGFTLVLGQPAKADVTTLQLNAFGFGGQNASLIVTRD